MLLLYSCCWRWQRLSLGDSSRSVSGAAAYCWENRDTYPHMQHIQWGGGRTTRAWPIYARDIRTMNGLSTLWMHNNSFRSKNELIHQGQQLWDKRPTQSTSQHGGSNYRWGDTECMHSVQDHFRGFGLILEYFHFVFYCCYKRTSVFCLLLCSWLLCISTF